MKGRRLLRGAALAVLLLVPALADVTGKWTAAIDTQIGVQNYTYDFKVDGDKLTGRAKSQFGDTAITEGTVKGDDLLCGDSRLPGPVIAHHIQGQGLRRGDQVHAPGGGRRYRRVRGDTGEVKNGEASRPTCNRFAEARPANGRC